ncbi:MAG: DUF1360 domain-containing protein [Micromonosporaceae bacterium]|nr:DUF1360 domain-containing protein [Micromonosporaceae bacterium]
MLRRLAAGYSPGKDRPLGGYLATLLGYVGVCASLVGVAARTGHQAPERLSTQDVLLVSLATHKISRLLAKDPVTSPLRAPFTRYQHPNGDAELGERVRGSGLRRALGELISCPFCLGVWVATGFSAGLVFAPRLTRLVAVTFTAVAVSDLLQLGYAVAQQAPSRIAG